ncbi:acetyl-CoA C-acetyltransferase [Pseudokineococcus basanitobsidens]|uniref:Acetyl-CoA C-acetyltransferase n=1 Tax=Pseudokineococcus basanitobsidens TaxID=1926649 RepID=A0ABU8RMP8_9ACTN
MAAAPSSSTSPRPFGPAAAPRPVAVVAGTRIPFARSGRAYAEASNQEMLTAVLDGLARRAGLEGERVDEVVAGAVVRHSRDLTLTREAVLGSVLDPTTPAHDVGQACGTGLQAALAVAGKVALGQVDVGIAGGADTTSDAPVVVSEGLRRALLRASREKSTAGKVRALAAVRPKDLVPVPPRNAEPRTGLSMGEHQARTTLEWGITREAQDELALASHHRLEAAYESGFLDDLVVAHRGLERDDVLRPGLTLSQLERLRPVFGRGEAATMTAGTSTPLSDGASAVLLSSPEWAAGRGLEPMAYLVDAETAAVDHVSGAEGLLMAPAYAVSRLLARTGLCLQDFDVVEIHEAFASQVLCTLAAWEDPLFCRVRLGRDEPLGAVDRERLNPHGGSLAAGHPFAATGARVLASAAKALAVRGGGRALVSVCAAGGQGVVAVLER